MDQFENFKKIVAQRKQENDDKYKETSKKRMIENVCKRMRTNMIGALAAFEESFGELWGKGKKTLNSAEQDCYNIWQDTRAKILDQGNNNIRIVQEEISQYDCHWNRYQYDVVFGKEIK